jgi:hypothetical protein
MDEQPPYATVDLDGVVADVRHRLHFIWQRPKNWAAFFAAAVDDPVLPEGRAVVDELAARGYELVWLTGRPERCRADTLGWLREHDLPAGRLLMRREGDRRPSRLAKLDILRGLARRRPVAVAVDDDAEVVQAMREAGFEVLHAQWMPEEPTLRDAQEREGRT